MEEQEPKTQKKPVAPKTLTFAAWDKEYGASMDIDPNKTLLTREQYVKMKQRGIWKGRAKPFISFGAKAFERIGKNFEQGIEGFSKEEGSGSLFDNVGRKSQDRAFAEKQAPKPKGSKRKKEKK